MSDANFVDRFETLDGDPLLTEADREAAAKLGHSTNRTPTRTEIRGSTKPSSTTAASSADADRNQHPLRSGDRNLPRHVAQQQQPLVGIAWGSNRLEEDSNTGYYVNKLWNGQLGTSAAHQHRSPLSPWRSSTSTTPRRPTKPAPDGPAGLPMTALDAVNKVRNRAGMPDVLDKFTGSAPLLRETHPQRTLRRTGLRGTPLLHDIRRWKIARRPVPRRLRACTSRRCRFRTNSPCGRRYVRQPIPTTGSPTGRTPCTLPFPQKAEANKMKISSTMNFGRILARI